MKPTTRGPEAGLYRTLVRRWLPFTSYWWTVAFRNAEVFSIAHRNISIMRNATLSCSKEIEKKLAN
jgi:hypothetical protein